MAIIIFYIPLIIQPGNLDPKKNHEKKYRPASGRDFCSNTDRHPPVCSFSRQWCQATQASAGKNSKELEMAHDTLLIAIAKIEDLQAELIAYKLNSDILASQRDSLLLVFRSGNR